jgi:hypothetical protein
MLELPGIELKPSLIKPADSLSIVLLAQVDEKPTSLSVHQAGLQALRRSSSPDRRENGSASHESLPAIEIQCQYIIAYRL